MLDGNNTDEISKAVYSEWKKSHQNDGLISGSKQADMKTAIVEKFKNNATILIGTEAASEGINLKFCSLVVNYDLPWNPKRVEQRIGRCHRYGQKNDVVVINFLNEKKAADRRVYELLKKKFKLFNGVLGASDEILGAIESGIDFEKRILNIYQNCKTPEEIQKGFDDLQYEFADKIEETMLETSQSILEELDEEVIQRLKIRDEDTRSSLDIFRRRLYDFAVMCGAVPVTTDELGMRFRKTGEEEKIYNLDWKDAESKKETFLRKDDTFLSDWLDEAVKEELDKVNIQFDFTNSPRKVNFFKDKIGLKGLLSIDKMIHFGANDSFSEYLIITIINDRNIDMDNGIVDRMFTLYGKISGEFEGISPEFIKRNKDLIELQKKYIRDNNRKYWLEECEKLDDNARDLKEGLERDIKALDKIIDEHKKNFRENQDEKSMPELLEFREKSKT